MKLAYIITAYKLPEQVVRLAKRLADPETSMIIHVDRKSPLSVLQAIQRGLQGIPNIYFSREFTVHYMSTGHMRAVLHCMTELLNRKVPFDYCVYISAQDYPIKPRAEIERTLSQRPGVSYINHFHLPHEGWVGEGGLWRTDDWHIHLGRLYVRAGKRFTRPLSFSSSAAGTIVNIKTPWRRRFLAGYEPFGGSPFSWLTRAHVEYIVDKVRKEPRLLRFFHYVGIPEESFFATILANSKHGGELVNDELRYVDWSEGSIHPKILCKSDFGRFVAPNYLFARKFDPTVDPGVLDRIDRELLSYCQVES